VVSGPEPVYTLVTKTVAKGKLFLARINRLTQELSGSQTTTFQLAARLVDVDGAAAVVAEPVFFAIV